MTRVPWIIWQAIAVHIGWGVLALIHFDGLAPFFAAILLDYEPPAIGGLLVSVGIMALIALIHNGNQRLRLMLLLPQQGVLTLSALGSLNIAIVGQIVNGADVPDRTVAIVLLLPILVLAIFHSLAILDLYGVEFHWRLPRNS